jgi:hypothetical protein
LPVSSPAGNGADDRHDDVADQRRDDGSERRADDDADGKIDHVAAHREFFEFFPHGNLRSDFHRMRRGATGAGGINRSGLRDQSPAQMRGSRHEAGRNGPDNLHPSTTNRHLVGGLPAAHARAQTASSFCHQVAQ